jgi:hypothetical protein
LRSMGMLTGGEWNTGALTIWANLDLLLLELTGLRAGIEANIDLSIGLNLPDPSVLLDLDVDLMAALEGMVDAQLDIQADIDLIDLKIDLILDLVAELDAQLSVDGLHVWTYEGPAAELGTNLAAELVDGLPGSGAPNHAIYGVAIACASPTAWAAFGNIVVVV